MAKLQSFGPLMFVLLGLFVLFKPCLNEGIVLVSNSSVNATTLNNSLKCKTWNNSVCVECLNGYYFNANGVCSLISMLCEQYNLDAGICQICYDGYFIVDGNCVSNETLVGVEDPGCRIFKSNICIQCSQRWFFNKNGQCQQVDDNCRSWNSNGQCLSCYNGYELTFGKCVLKINNQTISNPLCKTWSGDFCIQCSYRAFFNSSYICQQVSPNCNTWDKLTGKCLTCYSGFSLIGSNCLVSNQSSDWMDPLCRKFDWQRKICLECSQRTFKNSNGKCTQVNPLCKTYSQLICLSCYDGYELSNSQCIVKKSSQPSQPTDPGCAKWDWPNQKCLKCSFRYYFNFQGICSPVSDLCRTFNQISGKCLSCYQGYFLNGSVCQKATLSDLNCQTFQGNVCILCSNRYYFNSNGVCTKVSDLCQTWNTSSGSCTSCYTGYTISQGACILSSPKPEGCSYWNSLVKICQVCYNNYCLNQLNICIKKMDNCSTCDSAGGCSKCNDGYHIQNSSCVQDQSGCKQKIGNQCKSCYQNSFLFSGYCLTFSQLQQIFNFYTQNNPNNQLNIKTSN